MASYCIFILYTPVQDSHSTRLPLALCRAKDSDPCGHTLRGHSAILLVWYMLGIAWPPAHADSCLQADNNGRTLILGIPFSRSFWSLINNIYRRPFSKRMTAQLRRAEKKSRTHFSAIMMIFYCKQRNKNTIYRTFISDFCETSIIPWHTYKYKIIGQKLPRTNIKCSENSNKLQLLVTLVR